MKVRYDFWSLVVALKSGLSHGGATPASRAKRIADDLLAIEPGERARLLEQLQSAIEYLEAIQGEVACRETHSNTETRVLASQELEELRQLVASPPP